MPKRTAYWVQRLLSAFETRRRVGMVLSAMGVVLALALFAVDRWAGYPIDHRGWLELVIAAAGLLSLALLRAGFYALVAWVMLGSLFFVTAASAYFFGSARTVNLSLIVAGQVVVGLFLGHKELIWATLGGTALILGLSWADTHGYLMANPNFEVNFRTWAVQAAALAGVALMVYANRTQLRLAQEKLFQESTQRLRTRTERDEGLDRFRLVFNSSPTPIFVQSARSGAILDANPAFEVVTGYARKEVLSRRDGFLWVKDEQLEAFERERRTQARTAWLPIRCVRSDGAQVELLICSEVDSSAEDGLIISVMRQVNGGDLRQLHWSGSFKDTNDLYEELGVKDD